MSNDSAESGHTPGPWSFVRKEQKSECCGATMSRIGYVKADSGYTEVAVLYRDEGQEADGHLIAAAPDLLAAVKEYIEWGAMTGSDRDLFDDKFRAAIAKAEGR